MNTKKEMIRFLIAGCFVVATDVGIYYLLIHFLAFSISKAISFTCAGVVGYVFNKYWTFKYLRRSYAEAGRYALINVMALGINVIANQGILDAHHGAVYPALVIATTVTSVFTFVFFKWWVFATLLK